jgi:DNA polymerase-3 subunit delta
MSAEKLIASWKKKSFRPVYWLEGEEDYYIDKVMEFAEHQILTESEASFNLSVFYGRDADWAAIINACRRYPMFSERQVVLLKEAQFMKDIDKLSGYLESPLESTVLVIAYKSKSYDKRTKFYNILKSQAEITGFPKIKDEHVEEWIRDLVKSKGITISAKAAGLLHEHAGADLSRIEGEIEKISVNLKDRAEIDDNDIEKFVGISKEYNIFELQAAIAFRDMSKAMKILNYFEGNPKAEPIQKAIPALYANVSKVYAAFSLPQPSDANLKPLFYFNSNAVAQAKTMMKSYGFDGVEKMILLMHQYNLKSIGVGDSGSSGASLLKEMVAKIMMG